MPSSENVEIHPPPDEDCTFGPETTWLVASGYRFEFSGDGNLQILNPARERVWESGTAGSEARKFSLQSTGELILCSGNGGEPLWRARTGSSPGAFLAFQNDGNLVLYSAEREPLWATDTNGK